MHPTRPRWLFIAHRAQRTYPSRREVMKSVVVCSYLGVLCTHRISAWEARVWGLPLAITAQVVHSPYKP